MRKRLERLGRRLLGLLLGALLGRRHEAVELGARPRFLVVRLDQRVGNLVMTLPLIDSLRARFPEASIDLLADAKNAALLARHPTLSRFRGYRKRALVSAEGPLGTVAALRRVRYDVVLDATNPTDPSFTQAVIVRLSGARYAIGYAHESYGRTYSSTVRAEASHEIDMRLALLEPLPGTARLRQPRLAVSTAPPSRRPLAVVNIGARLSEKRLTASVYARLATVCCDAGHEVLLTFGPGEQRLAADVAAIETRAKLAPPTNLVELARLFASAIRVVSCDTGPMHLAVAAGTPTLGIFVSTDPVRYGYATPPNAVIDARAGDLDEVVTLARAWLAGPGFSRGQVDDRQA
jgi:heptosyltransferase III